MMPLPQHAGRSREWARHRVVSDGVELLEAAFDHHVYERHIHETYAIGFTLRGVQRFWCRGATYDSTPGDVIAINPGEAHDGRSGAPGGYAYRMFYFTVDRVQHIIEEAREAGVESIDSGIPRMTNPRLSRKLDVAWKAINSSANSLAADELLHEAVQVLALQHSPQISNAQIRLDQPALSRVREYLRERVADPVSVQELATVASMSRFQLTRQFQRAFGLPLHAYHVHLRLEESKRRLQNGQPIATVATDLGFVDQSHFHRRFRGTFGLTPGEWRRFNSVAR